MIGEAVDLGSGTLSIVLVVGLLVVAAGAGAGIATIRGAIARLGERLDDLAKVCRSIAREAQDHRHDDAERFQDQELRMARVEDALERDGLLTPVRDPPRLPSGPQSRIRTEPPRARRETPDGPGESR